MSEEATIKKIQSFIDYFMSIIEGKELTAEALNEAYKTFDEHCTKNLYYYVELRALPSQDAYVFDVRLVVSHRQFDDIKIGLVNTGESGYKKSADNRWYRKGIFVYDLAHGSIPTKVWEDAEILFPGTHAELRRRKDLRSSSEWDWIGE